MVLTNKRSTFESLDDTMTISTCIATYPNKSNKC